MIKVEDITLNQFKKTAKVSLFADSKAEVLPNAEIEGMPDGYDIEAGSTIRTGDWEVATMLSTGTWSWS